MRLLVCVRFYSGFPCDPVMQCFQFSGSFSFAKKKKKKIFFHLQEPNDYSNSTSPNWVILPKCLLCNKKYSILTSFNPI